MWVCVCVIADTERLNTMSMFTCVLTSGSLYSHLQTLLYQKNTTIKLSTSVSLLELCKPVVICGVFGEICKQVSVNFNSVSVCYSMFVPVFMAWNLSLAALLIRHRRWMNPEWTEGKPTVWAVNKRWERFRTEPHWAPGSMYALKKKGRKKRQRFTQTFPLDWKKKQSC